MALKEKLVLDITCLLRTSVHVLCARVYVDDVDVCILESEGRKSRIFGSSRRRWYSKPNFV